VLNTSSIAIVDLLYFTR